MKVVYYFSGTGNSLFAAKNIAKKINGVLTPIYSVMHQDRITTDANIIGIVFPTYYEPYGGVPLIVRRFVNKLENLDDKYIFAICTYGSGSFKAIACLRELIKSRGGNLSIGFTVNMPNNMAGSRINNTKNQQKMFHVWEENMEIILKMITAQKKGEYNMPNILVGRVYNLIKLVIPNLIFIFKPLTRRHLERYYQSKNGSYEEILPYMDRSFYINDKCVGCGNCAKICPVENIEIIDDRPFWQHKCEFCLACFHWCPQEAIESNELRSTVRYHHPSIKFSEMILGKDKGPKN